MPTNLPLEARDKWKEVSLAKKPEEKIEKLQEFLSLVPKHKGTENLRAKLKTRIAVLRKEINDKKQKKSGSSLKFFIEKEGDAQIVILGLTKVGRSSFLSVLTNAKVEISDYPYATKEPIPGMFKYQDLLFQLVEAPALIEESNESGTWRLQTLAVARNADGLIIMVDLEQDPVKQIKIILEELDKSKILTRKPKARVEIERMYKGAGLKLIITGHLLNCTSNDIEKILKNYGINDAIVKIHGEASLDDIEETIFEDKVYRPILILANKSDIAGSLEVFDQLTNFIGNKFKLFSISCKNKIGFEIIGREIFMMLDIVRIYTKEPNEKHHSQRPFTIKKGSTILDLAKKIHSDFYKQFSFAKVWSKRLKFSPQKVGGTFFLEDEDIVELHMR